MARVTEVTEGVWQVCAGSFPSNSYVVRLSGSDRGFLVDAGLDAAAIDETLTRLGVEPSAVLCTHGHFDHVGSASFFQKKYGSAVYLHAADRRTATSANFLLMAFKVPDRIELPRFELVNGEAATVDLGGIEAEYRLVPGHSPGSCLVTVGSICFSGDTIYAAGIGKSEVPGERPGVLRESLRRVWNEIPGDAVVCPGHGLVDRFETIRRQNRELLDFVGLVAPGEY